MNADGSGVARLTNDPAFDGSPALSPDGRQIAFTSDRNGNWDLFVMDADGSNQRAITNNSNWELFPAWSPDGSRIAFQTQRSGNFELYVMNPDGSGQRPLAAHPADELCPPGRYLPQSCLKKAASFARQVV